MKVWDVIIIGAGPAAIQAAIMGASEGMQILVIERDRVGGQIGQTPLLENFIAANGGVTGPQFAGAMRAQAEKMGATILKGDVNGFRQFRDHFIVEADDAVSYASHTIIIATGNRWQDLDIPGIRDGIRQNRVHYGPVNCLSVDAEGQEVAVYGGGPSAGQAIIALAAKATKVHVLMRSTLRMPQYLVDTILALPNVELYEHAKIAEVETYTGMAFLSVDLDGPTLTANSFAVSHLFMCSGLLPNTEWLPAKIKKDESGRVLVGGVVGANSFLGTSMPGVFAIGDVRYGSTARVSAAIGDGAFVVTELWKYFREHKTCSFCKPEVFARAAADANPLRVGQSVTMQGLTGTAQVIEVLNGQQVRLDSIAGPVDVARLQVA